MTDPEIARASFDAIASRGTVARMSAQDFERYAAPRHPHLFAKEMMFSLAGELRGKKVLEVGCGQGVAAVQLAHCGADVWGMDISPVSIGLARERAKLHDLPAQFAVSDITSEGIPFDETFDIVWFDLVLHHLVGRLDLVMDRVSSRLREGGLFIAREPIAYAGWLKRLRQSLPIVAHDTPDGQPLRAQDIELIRRHFPDLQQRYYRITARADALTGNMLLLRQLARLDNLLLLAPGMSALAGNAVMWANRRSPRA